LGEPDCADAKYHCGGDSYEDEPDIGQLAMRTETADMVPCQKGKWEPCGDRSDRRACEHSARLRDPRRFWLPETFLWQAGKLPFDARCYFLVDFFWNDSMTASLYSDPSS
jgi:hypothetical protein